MQNKRKIAEKPQLTCEQMSILSRFIAPLTASWGILQLFLIPE